MALVVSRSGVLAAFLLLLRVLQTMSFSSNLQRVQCDASHNKDSAAGRWGVSRRSSCLANSERLGRAKRRVSVGVSSSRLRATTEQAECSSEDWVNIGAVRATFSPKNQYPLSRLDRAMSAGFMSNIALQRNKENVSELATQTAEQQPRRTTFVAKENYEQLDSFSSANKSASSSPLKNRVGLLNMEHGHDLQQSPAAPKPSSPLSLSVSDPIARFSGKLGTTDIKVSKIAIPAIAAATVGPLSPSGSVSSLLGQFAEELRAWTIMTGGIEQEYRQHRRSHRVTRDVGVDSQQAGLYELCSAIAQVEKRLSKESSQSRQLRVGRNAASSIYGVHENASYM